MLEDIFKKIMVLEDLFKLNYSSKIVSVLFAGGTKEASLLVYLGHLGGVACPGPPRSADPMESHCRGIFSHRG